MNTPRGWVSANEENMPAVATISDLVAITGLSRRTVRDMIRRYDVPQLPPESRFDPRMFDGEVMLRAIQGMVGKGNRL